MRSVSSPLSSGDEALELRDFGASDCTPSEPLGSVVTWQDVEDMYRNELARPAGYVDAMCLGCGCALFVPENERAGDVLCPACQRPDDDPAPPGGGYAADVATLADGALVEAVAMVDESAAGRGWCVPLGLHTDEQRTAYLSAATAEVLRRVDARKAAA